jgi:hypothetical protein
MYSIGDGDDDSCRGEWLSYDKLFKLRGQQVEADRPDPLDEWFGANTPSGRASARILVQETSHRMYEGQLKCYDEGEELWSVHFPHQQDDPVFGTSACDAEDQVFDLVSLELHKRSPCSTASESQLSARVNVQKRPAQMVVHRYCAHTEGGKRRRLRQRCPVQLQDCHVLIEPLPPCVHRPRATAGPIGRHRFWVCKHHFHLEFVQSKLHKKLRHVQGQAIDVEVMFEKLTIPNDIVDDVDDKQMSSEQHLLRTFMTKKLGDRARDSAQMLVVAQGTRRSGRIARPAS